MESYRTFGTHMMASLKLNRAMSVERKVMIKRQGITLEHLRLPV